MTQEHETVGDADALRALCESRWSCRAFLPDPVPRERIADMLEIAQCSPSWCNTQPWQVHVACGQATERLRSGLLAVATSTAISMAPDILPPTEYRGDLLRRRREVGWQLYKSLGISRGDYDSSARQNLKNFALFDAPHAAVITVPADLGVYGVLDAGVYLGNLLLAARASGLGAIAQASLAMYSPFVRDFFNIPEDQHVLVGMSFGWPDLDHPANQFRSSRASLEDVVHWQDN